MFHGQRGGSVGLIPVGGSEVQLADDLGLDPLKLTEQELPEQGVVAIPPPPTVQRHQEQTRRLQVAQLRGRTGVVADGVAQRSAQLIEHRGAPQEPLHRLRQLHQRLAVQVVGHIPILTGDGQHLTSTVLRDQRGQVEPDRPSFRPGGHGGGQPRGEAHVGLREDLLRTRSVQGQVAGRNFHRVTRNPQPGQMRLLGATRRHQLRTVRNPRDHHAQHIMTSRRPQLMKIIKHQHERHRGSAQRRGQPRRGAAQRRRSQPTHVGDQIGAARNPRIRRRQQQQQGRRVIIQPVQRHPPNPSMLGLGPLRHQHRLAITSRRRDPDHPATTGTSRLDQTGTAHRTGPPARRRQLRLKQHRLERSNRRPSPAGIVGHNRTRTLNSEVARDQGVHDSLHPANRRVRH